MREIYKKAFTEVCEILNYLDDESYNDIPKDIIEALEENRNKEYKYFLDKSIPFTEQKMLDETKAILFNLYRDYLATPERKKKIIDYQNEELKILEQEKIKEYNSNDIFKEKRTQKHIEQTALVEIKKVRWYQKLFSYFKHHYK